jgi:O-acetyl-ADP-ribose deacetylase (regulator of RNase III)
MADSISALAPEASSTPNTAPAAMPSFHLLCMEKKYITAWNSAVVTHELPSSIKVTTHYDRLAELSSTVKFDAIVSPANSYGRMDGGFDDALSRAFSPKQDYLALTRVVQAKFYEEWRGFAPPSSCTLVDLKGDESLKKNEWGCRYMALCPTMKIPQKVIWDREVVYECIWSLLASIDKHNRKVKRMDERKDNMDGREKTETEIKNVLMTPLATGFGGWTPEMWAAQTVLAFKHFVEAVENESRWNVMGTFRAFAHCDEVSHTYAL